MSKSTQIVTLGDESILDLAKVGFLSSRKVPPAAVIKCYDWATEMRDRGVCVMGGFQSPLERDVLTLLLQGKQPVIWVLAHKLWILWGQALWKRVFSGIWGVKAKGGWHGPGYPPQIINIMVRCDYTLRRWSDGCKRVREGESTPAQVGRGRAGLLQGLGKRRADQGGVGAIRVEPLSEREHADGIL